jgi:hypothetical protein
MSASWLVRTVAAGLLLAAAVLPALPASRAQAAPPAQGVFARGAVIGLQGTPELWFADDQGVVHWGGDTRALAGRDVNWATRLEVTLDQLQRLPRGDPWLSAGLVKLGDPIYLPKWETAAAAPALYHIQSIEDVQLFGISGTNYGALVLDGDAWRGRYGFDPTSLPRAELEAVSGATEVPAAPEVAPAALVVPNQAVISGRGDRADTSWVVGEVRHDGGQTACGLSVTATFSDSAGNVVASRRMGTERHPIAAGEIWPYQITFRNLPAYQHLDVRAAPGTGPACTAVDLPVRDVDVCQEEDDAGTTFHATGTVRNTAGRAVTGVRVVVWFVDGDGSVMDVVSPEGGEPAAADRLGRGQSTAFDVASKSSAINGWVKNIAGAKAVAFGD